MKKILLTAVNAKYIHTCPAIYSLKAYADLKKPENTKIQTAEYTINDRYQDVLAGILSHHADVIAFSVYIWNIDRVRRLIRDIRKISGESLQIWAGGPEATWYPEPLLKDGVDLCMLGEGEEVFSRLVSWISESDIPDQKQDQYNASFPPEPAVFPLNTRLDHIPGIAYVSNGTTVRTGSSPLPDLNSIPFLYPDLEAFSHRILYYESSRGCPFGCAYCLSGKERGIRYRDSEKVEKELQFFLDHKVPQVKFIDRTFNANADHALRIWRYIKEHDNGITNFHFEIEGDRLTEEELELLQTLRPGLVQMEIGIQSANPLTLKSVHRSGSLVRIAEACAALIKNQNINIHLDLIAGLPYEDLESFKNSFNAVYGMRPHQFQLGFLKLLKGTELYERREEYGLVCSEDAPYEVLKTRWLSYEDLHLLHRISDRVEEYVNSQGFRRSLPLAEALFTDAFTMFEALADYYLENDLEIHTPSVTRRYEVFSQFIENQKMSAEDLHILKETIRLDQYLHTHPSRRMTAEATFELQEGPVHLHFNYKKTSPVNGEAETTQ